MPEHCGSENNSFYLFDYQLSVKSMLTVLSDGLEYSLPLILLGALTGL